MPSASAAFDIRVAAILSGAVDDLRALLAHIFPNEADGAVAEDLVGLFWRAWCRHVDLHDDFIAQLRLLPEALAQLQPAAWVSAPEHPLWPLLATLRQAGAGYQPELGKAGERLLAEWAALLQALAAGDWAGTLTAAQQHWQREQDKLARLEQRLIDSEQGQLRSRRAQQLAARELNRAMGGRQFSAALIEFLQRDWLGELQWCQLQFGDDSPQWRQRIDLTQRLVESLQDPEQDVAARQRLFDLIPDVLSDLRTALLERAHDEAAVEPQLALIEAQHMALSRSLPVEAQPFALIASDDPWASSAMSLSRDLLQRVAELPLGSVYRVREGEREQRVKLVLKMEATAQLLFVNRLGVKALLKSCDEFAYWLATDIARPLPDAADSPQILRSVLQQLLARSEQQSRLQAEQRQREADELQRRRAAAEKAIAEARMLAEAQARVQREAEQRARELELARRREQADEDYRGDDSQRLRQARQSAASLAIGAWVEFYDEFGDSERLRLAVKLSSSGKLIFVDREGVRRAECERDLFAARLLDGSVRILNQGPQFEDTLARVVGSLRRERVIRE